jgi:hypothetical protein
VNENVLRSRMSCEQLENLVFGRSQRLSDDRALWDWLPHVAADLTAVQVGLWRCPSGEVICPEGECGDCACCVGTQSCGRARSTGSPSAGTAVARRCSWKSSVASTTPRSLHDRLARAVQKALHVALRLEPCPDPSPGPCGASTPGPFSA